MPNSLDIEKSIKAANGNASLAKELFTMLLADLELRLGQIKVSFESNDLEQLAEHIHKLYGATAYCIVPELRKHVATLDGVLKNDSSIEVDELVEKVLLVMQQLISEGPSHLEKDWNIFSIEES